MREGIVSWGFLNVYLETFALIHTSLITSTVFCSYVTSWRFGISIYMLIHSNRECRIVPNISKEVTCKGAHSGRTQCTTIRKKVQDKRLIRYWNRKSSSWMLSICIIYYTDCDVRILVHNFHQRMLEDEIPTRLEAYNMKTYILTQYCLLYPLI